MSYKYENTPIKRQPETGTQYYETNVYPSIPVVQGDNYVITTLGDRLDLLALDFYGDMDLWRVIATANSLPGDSLYPPVGAQIRIPTNPIQIINKYKSENANR